MPHHVTRQGRQGTKRNFVKKKNHRINALINYRINSVIPK